MSEPITLAEIEAIEAYCAKATEGPWCPRWSNPDCEVMVVPRMHKRDIKIADCNVGDNTWFISQARADLPRLCAELKRRMVADECVVCHAELLPPSAPPHCEDCVVTDEDDPTVTGEVK